MPVQSVAFRHALGHFASGVTVVTVAHQGERNGLTVSAFCSVSLDPPYVLICIDKASSSNTVIQAASAFAVNILAVDQDSLSNHFAQRSDDKFDSVAFHEGILGMPILEGTVGHLECRLARMMDAGDHFIYIGEVEDSQVDENQNPLLYYVGKYRNLAEA